MCASVRHYFDAGCYSSQLSTLNPQPCPPVSPHTPVCHGARCVRHRGRGAPCRRSGAGALHQAGIVTAEVLVDLGGAEQCGCFALAGQAVVSEEEFLHGAVAAVVAVAALDVLHLFGREPVALALGEQCHALGIELRMVDGSVHINHLADVYAEETAAARRVGEQGGGVAGADERGDARKRDGVVAVGLAHA